MRWIVDPLDGTVNFLYGLPAWAVSVAAEVAGVVVAGAVCVPLQRSTFTRDARRRRVAGLGLGRRPTATGLQHRGSARATRSSPPALAIRPASEPSRARWWRRCCRRVRDIRRAGAAAVDLCSVAAGRVDAYYEQGTHYWDIAAGGLIAREAGADDGRPARRGSREAMTLAADPALFAELRELLASLDADRLPASRPPASGG